MRRTGPDPLIGRTIAGKFEIESFVGSGAMGAVYRARQTSLEKTVAIKVLHQENARDLTFAARFQREAKAASRLSHANSLAVLDYGEEADGLLYIVMEYLDGRNLHQVLREEWPIGSARAADIVMQVLAALAAAHDQGIVHRDIKPENVMVLRGTTDDGEPRDVIKVCDFGIAKITDQRGYKTASGQHDSGPATTAGFLVGTPEFMSPEQGKGEKLDPRSDLYSVGVILYQLLTRKVPFEAENAIGVVLRHITEEPTPPSKLNPVCDRRLEAICLRAMKKSRDERYPSAREMRGELRAIAAGPTSGRDPTSGPPPDMPDLENAQTVLAEAPVISSMRAAAEAVPAVKPTFAGTETEIPGLPTRRRKLATMMVVGTVVGLITGGIIFYRYIYTPRLSHPQPRLTPELAAEGDDLETDDDTPRGSASDAPSVHRDLSHGAPWRAHSATATASVSHSAPASSTSAAPSTTSLASTAPPAPATTSAPSVAPPVEYDAGHAYAIVGMVNAQGVAESVVGAAVRTLPLSSCYQNALKGRERAVGHAMLNLSIDEEGRVKAAVLVGASFLPPLARCVQGAAVRLRVPKGALSAGAATAEVSLEFVAP